MNWNAYLQTKTYSTLTFKGEPIPQAMLFEGKDSYIEITSNHMRTAQDFSRDRKQRSSANTYKKAGAGAEPTDNSEYGKMGEYAFALWFHKTLGAPLVEPDFTHYAEHEKSYDPDLLYRKASGGAVPDVQVKTACTYLSWVFQHDASSRVDKLFDLIQDKELRREKELRRAGVRWRRPSETQGWGQVTGTVAPEDDGWIALVRRVGDYGSTLLQVRGLVTWKYLVENGLVGDPDGESLRDKKKAVYLHDMHFTDRVCPSLRGLEEQIRITNGEPAPPFVNPYLTAGSIPVDPVLAEMF